MPSVRHILYPFDFSPRAIQIAPFVRVIAERFGARVTLLSIVPPSFDPVPDAMGGPHLRAGDDTAQWVAALRSRLDRALETELAGMELSRVAEVGDPAARIVEFAQEQAVDLIAMATHGVGRFRTFLVGSVAAKVLHDAPGPVWTAAHAEAQTAEPLPRRILCAVDGSQQTAALAQWASAYAHTIGAALSLLHVVGRVSDWPSLERERWLQESARNDARQAIRVLLTGTGVSAPLRVAVGAVVPAIAEEARQDQSDLIVIGRGRVAEPFGRLRTHAFGIIQQSPCPVISV